MKLSSAKHQQSKFDPDQSAHIGLELKHSDLDKMFASHQLSAKRMWWSLVIPCIAFLLIAIFYLPSAVLRASVPFERAFADLRTASKLAPLPGSENIRFGDSVTLEKMYAWKKGDDYEVFGIWHLHGRTSEAKNVGIHILDNHAEIIGQEDHNLLPALAIPYLAWLDCFGIRPEFARIGPEIGVCVYTDPKHLLEVKNGRRDLNGYRLLLKLPK